MREKGPKESIDARVRQVGAVSMKLRQRWLEANATIEIKGASNCQNGGLGGKKKMRVDNGPWNA